MGAAAAIADGRPDRRPKRLERRDLAISVANPTKVGERARQRGDAVIALWEFLSLLRRSPHLAEVFIREPRPLLLPQAPLDVMVQPRRTHPACLPSSCLRTLLYFAFASSLVSLSSLPLVASKPGWLLVLPLFWAWFRYSRTRPIAIATVPASVSTCLKNTVDWL